MYLKFYMEQIENTVVFRIIEQDIEDSSNNKQLGSFNGIFIEANFDASISEDVIYFRGEDKSLDHYTDCCVLDTDEEAKEQKQKYLKALEECFSINSLPKRGDTIFVRDRNVGQWVEALFVAFVEGAIYPYIVVKHGFKDEFLNGDRFFCSYFKEMKRTSSLKELGNNIYEVGAK